MLRVSHYGLAPIQNFTHWILHVAETAFELVLLR